MKSIIPILIMFTILGFIFLKGLDRHEKMECEIWQKQSQEFRGWYSTQNQKDQCLNYNITLTK